MVKAASAFPLGALGAALASYLLAIIWTIFLFPAVNISSGELKPRSFYVDEHALLVNSAEFPGSDADHGLLERSVKFAQSRNFSSYRAQRDACESVDVDLCSLIDKSVDCVRYESDADKVYILYPLNGLYHGMYLESVDVVVTYDRCSVHEALEFAQELTYIVSSHALPSPRFNPCFNQISAVTWLSKSVTLYLVPNRCFGEEKMYYTHYSHALEVLKFSPLSHMLHDAEQRSVLRMPMTRNAFIFKLDTCDASVATDGPHCMRGSCPDGDRHWSSADISFLGSNGILPNMDVITSVLAVYPNVNIYNDSPVYTEGPCERTVICNSLARLYAVFPWLGISSLHEYFARLDWLLSSLWSGVTEGVSPGLHAQYLNMNVEAVTVIRKAATKEIRTGRKTGRLGTPELVSMAITFIRLTSNLHGMYNV
jgi:hypothetical protein